MKRACDNPREKISLVTGWSVLAKFLRHEARIGIQTTNEMNEKLGPRDKLRKLLEDDNEIATDFLQSHLESLQRRIEAAPDGQLFYTAGSISEIFEDFEQALFYFSKSLEHFQNFFSIKKQIEFDMERMRRAVQCEQARLNLPSEKPKSVNIQRIKHDSITTKEFEETYAKTGTPVIITGLPKPQWTISYLKEKIGDIFVKPKVFVEGSSRWAKLEETGRTERMTVNAFMEKFEEDENPLYIHDASIPLNFPSLLSDVVVPKFFCQNFLNLLPEHYMYARSWPSLFLGPKDTISGLHVDAFKAHFWMQLISGRKKWTIFHRDDLHFLYPSWSHGNLDPTFTLKEEDLQGLSLDFPLLSYARRFECDLNPGEVLFVPNGSPHVVENITPTIAFSVNYINESNFDVCLDEMKLHSRVSSRAKDLVDFFARSHFQHLRTYCLPKAEENLSYHAHMHSNSVEVELDSSHPRKRRKLNVS